MSIAKFLAVLTAALCLSACGSDDNCKSACDKLNACGFGTSGVSCDAGCGGADAACAACVNDNSCPEIPVRCGGNGVGVCASWNFTPN